MFSFARVKTTKNKRLSSSSNWFLIAFSFERSIVFNIDVGSFTKSRFIAFPHFLSINFGIKTCLNSKPFDL